MTQYGKSLNIEVVRCEGENPLRVPLKDMCASKRVHRPHFLPAVVAAHVDAHFASLDMPA